jgi:twitching motility protein PilT
VDIIQLLTYAFEQKASDLHLTVGSVPVIRVNGHLKKLGETKLRPPETLDMAKDVTTDKQYEKLMEVGELDTSFSLPGYCRFRINIYKQRGSVGIACRVIKEYAPSLLELNLPDVVRTFAHKPQGLVLVTGPTGSGKSTTLAAIINYINDNMSKHIITLEDPIEYVHSHKKSLLNQREIGNDCKNFSAGLRAALRQDPDVILVGEMRDLETIKIAITAAETGHLVLATLHTTNAPQTIDRIIDVFPGEQQQQIRTQLAAVLVGIVSQRLIPISGQAGRMAATEILVNSSGVANLIRSDKIHQIKSLMETGRNTGMHTLEQSIQDMVQKGMISKQDALEYIPDWEPYM